MRAVTCTLVWVALALFTTSIGSAKEKGKAKDLKEESKTGVVATAIDFQAAFQLPFETLRGLGARIEQARAAVDPVGLALTSQELVVAEKVSGKQAGIKSADLMKEAIEAVKRRNLSAELNAVALLVQDAKTKDALLQQAKNDEKSRGISGTLTVYNNTPRTVAIYINDRQVGWVNSNNQASFFVGDDPFADTKLFGRSGSTTWGPRYVSRETGNYNWNLFLTNK